MRALALLAVLSLTGCHGAAGGVALGPPDAVFALPPVGDAPAQTPVQVVDTGPRESSGSGAQAPDAPVPPVLVPTAPSGSHGGSGSGGGSAPAPTAPRVEGQVIALELTGERPVPGAVVDLGDGRAVTTDDDGRFEVAGALPAGGTYAVRHPSYVNTAVAGLTGNQVTLHVRPREVVLAPGPAPATTNWTLHCRLAGSGVVSDVQAVLQDARGSIGRISAWAPDGTFTVGVQGVGGRIEAGSMLVRAVRDGVPLMASVTNLTLTPASPAIAPVVGQNVNHQVRFATTGAAAAGSPQATLTLVGPHDERLALSVPGDRLDVAVLPGVRYMLDLTARDYNQGVASVLHREAIAVTAAQPETVVSAELLEPPVVAPIPGLRAGDALAWAAVVGAKGYHLQLVGEEGQGVQWEAFSAANAFTVPAVGRPGMGAYRLTVTAWDQPDLNVRSVAAVSPRALRTLPIAPAGDFRRASAIVSETITTP